MSTAPTEELSREKTFKTKENSYNMKFPSIGQYIEIESKRMNLSNGAYSSMLNSNLISSQTAMDMIDMIATLSTLCPDLVKDLKSKSFIDMDIIDGRELLEDYRNQILPWLNSWMKVLKDPPKFETKEKASA